MKREAFKLMGFFAYVIIQAMILQACFGPMYR